MATGKIYGWTAGLARRSDMVPCDKNGRRTDEPGSDAAKMADTIEMKIFDGEYDVPKHLVDVITKLMAERVTPHAPEETTLMAIAHGEHHVPNSMVEDITALGESMKSLADANGMLQEEISNLLKEKKKLSKLYDKALSEKDDLIAAAKDRKKEISELKKQAKGENPAE